MGPLCEEAQIERGRTRNIEAYDGPVGTLNHHPKKTLGSHGLLTLRWTQARRASMLLVSSPSRPDSKVAGVGLALPQWGGPSAFLQRGEWSLACVQSSWAAWQTHERTGF